MSDLRQTTKYSAARESVMRPLVIVAKLARFELSAEARLEKGIAVLTAPDGFLAGTAAWQGLQMLEQRYGI